MKRLREEVMCTPAVRSTSDEAGQTTSSPRGSHVTDWTQAVAWHADNQNPIHSSF